MMTDFDKKLVEKAKEFSRFDYWQVDTLINIADTEEGAKRLYYVRLELQDLMLETN